MFVLLFIVSFLSCKSGKNGVGITGKWRVNDAKYLISADKDEWNKYKLRCVGELVQTRWVDGKIEFVVSDDCDQDDDLSRCGRISITPPLDVEIKTDNDEMFESSNLVVHSKTAYVSEGFLNTIRGNDKISSLEGHNTDCIISWGDETLKVILINEDRLILYFYSYVLILERVA